MPLSVRHVRHVVLIVKIRRRYSAAQITRRAALNCSERAAPARPGAFQRGASR